MKRALLLLACLPVLVACAAPVVTEKRAVTLEDNALEISSGSWNKGSGAWTKGRFVSVENTAKAWKGDLEGGKEKWIARRDFLSSLAQNEIRDICGEMFFSIHKGPIYNMLDNDETLGGAAPALGVMASMAAYLVAEARTQDANIPVSAYVEFNCEGDAKPGY